MNDVFQVVKTTRIICCDKKLEICKQHSAQQILRCSMFCNTPRQAHSSQCTLPLTIIGTSAILLLLGLLLACFLACFVGSCRMNRSRRCSNRTATVLCSGSITTFKYSEDVPPQSLGVCKSNIVSEVAKAPCTSVGQLIC